MRCEGEGAHVSCLYDFRIDLIRFPFRSLFYLSGSIPFVACLVP